MRRKREISFQIHLSPPLPISLDSLERYSTFFFYSTAIGNIAAGLAKKRKEKKPVGFRGSLACETRKHPKSLFHDNIHSQSAFVWKKPAYAYLHLQELYISTLSWLKLCMAWEVSFSTDHRRSELGAYIIFQSFTFYTAPQKSFLLV